MINRTTENILYIIVLFREIKRVSTHLSCQREGQGFAPRTLLRFYPSFSQPPPTTPYTQSMQMRLQLRSPSSLPATRQCNLRLNIHRVCITRFFQLSARPHVKTCLPRRILYCFYFHFLLDCFNIMTVITQYPPNYTELLGTCNHKITPLASQIRAQRSK